MISFLAPEEPRGSSSVNVFDLCLIDDTDLIKNLEITTRLGNSDHLSIEVELTFLKSEFNKDSARRNFYKGDYIKTNQKLLEIN